MTRTEIKTIISFIVQVIIYIAEMVAIIYVASFGLLMPVLFTVFVCIVIDGAIWLGKKLF